MTKESLLSCYPRMDPPEHVIGIRASRCVEDVS
jgi:hypothetical protein